MATLSLDITAMVATQCITGIEMRERLENFCFFDLLDVYALCLPYTQCRYEAIF